MYKILAILVEILSVLHFDAVISIVKQLRREYNNELINVIIITDFYMYLRDCNYSANINIRFSNLYLKKTTEFQILNIKRNCKF